MKVVTAEQMYEIDKEAIENYGVDGIILMENAGLNVVLRMEKEYGSFAGKIINIACGPGNNGGDGYVVARHLINQGALVNVFLLFPEEKETELKKETAVNLALLKKISNKIYRINDIENLKLYEGILVSAHFVVDAIFGTGFHGEVNELFAEAINLINRVSIPVISVDIPSGLNGTTGIAAQHTVFADLTVTFGLPKVGQIIVDGPKYVGKLVVADISIPRDILVQKDIRLNLTEYQDIRYELPVRPLDVYKGQTGRLMIIGGSTGLTGAAVLASEAALRMGVGVATLFCPETLNPIFEQKLTEVMTFPLADDGAGYFINKSVNNALYESGKYDAVLIGNGIGRADETLSFLLNFIEKVNKPLIIDGDALSLLKGHTELLKSKTTPVMITPHYMEMQRLSGVELEKIVIDPIAVAQNFCSKTGALTVLKSFRTVIASATGETYINATGNAGMATVGMGDVYAGFLASLFCQGLSPLSAAKVSAYLLGATGDYIARGFNENSIIASDVIEFLPKAMKELEAK